MEHEFRESGDPQTPRDATSCWLSLEEGCHSDEVTSKIPSRAKDNAMNT